MQFMRKSNSTNHQVRYPQAQCPSSTHINGVYDHLSVGLQASVTNLDHPAP